MSRTRWRVSAWVGLLWIGLLAAPTGQADTTGITWVIGGEQTASQRIDKTRAAEMYRDALAWLEEKTDWHGRPLRPRITVHVGEPCPVGEVAGGCMNPALGVLYVPEWNNEAIEALAEVTILTALRQIIEPSETELLV